MFRRYFLPALVFLFYRALVVTWRITRDESPTFQEALRQRRPVILAHWHGDELALIHLAKRYRIATITSTSKDGELMTRVLQWLGAVTARGSSTRGGASALRGVISLCKRGGHNISMAVDGPKGPIYHVKPGVFELSRLLDAPIYTVSVSVERPWIFHRSWNKAVLPKAFSRVHVCVAEGLPVITKSTDPRSGELAEDLANKLKTRRLQVNAVLGVDRP